MGRKVVIGVIAALSLIGVFSLYGIIQQAREDYSNFRKIVMWVAQKQQEEQRAKQMLPQPVVPPPTAPATQAAPTTPGKQ